MADDGTKEALKDLAPRDKEAAGLPKWHHMSCR